MKFRYLAKRGGVSESGVVDAAGEREAAARLRDRGLIPIEIRAGGNETRALPKIFSRRVKLGERAVFFRELATMTGAGVPAAASLRVLSGQRRSRRFDAVTASVYSRVVSGAPLAAAFAEHPECFDAVTVALVRAGEESGTLDASLAKIASFLEAREELRKKLISALTYPALVMLVAAASLIVMTSVVIPQFERAFRGLGVELPPLTRAIFRFGLWAEAHWQSAAIALAALLIFAKLALRLPRVRAAADAAILKFPIFGDMLLKASLARAFATMSVLMRAGVPVLSSLELAASAAGNGRVKKSFDAAREGAAAGRSLSSELGADPIFPRMISQMAAVGEETGRTGEMLGKIAEWYDSELSEKVRRLGSILEPLLVAAVGAAVALAAVAVFMPMVSAINAFI